MIEFPDPKLADDDGLIAQGGEISPEYLLSAYWQGIYPWFCEGEPILWWSPNPRMILRPDKFKLRKSLAQVIKKGTFELRVDTAFREVITHCSRIPRADDAETWITSDIINGYVMLHKMGVAHSFESYHNGELAGGLYGISLGKCFFGESMFFKKTDASKVALYHLVQFALKHNFSFIDAQQPTDHLKSLGAETISRTKFLTLLETALLGKTICRKWTDLVDQWCSCLSESSDLTNIARDAKRDDQLKEQKITVFRYENRWVFEYSDVIKVDILEFGEEKKRKEVQEPS